MKASVAMPVLRYWGRVARSELRCHRRLRLALLRAAAGMTLPEVVGALTGFHDIDTLRIGDRWFLIGPEEPTDTDRWSWWVCGPGVDDHDHAVWSMAYESWVTGYGPRQVLAFCRGWNLGTSALIATD